MIFDRQTAFMAMHPSLMDLVAEAVCLDTDQAHGGADDPTVDAQLRALAASNWSAFDEVARKVWPNRGQA
jgi:hypothetical protein